MLTRSNEIFKKIQPGTLPLMRFCINGLTLVLALVFFMEKETWKIIPTYPMYEVSNNGKIKRTKTNRELSQFESGSPGYLSVNIRFKKIAYQERVHRLVAVSFLGNPKTKKHQINHKNGIKSDNRIENLEWVTSKENIRHSIILGLKKTTYIFRKLNRSSIIKIKELISKGEKDVEIAKKFSVSRQLINDIRLGKRNYSKTKEK